ncbi:hypothetical protein MASR1M50_02000 [Burkholderiales bacterium]
MNQPAAPADVPATAPEHDENKLIAERRDKLRAIRAAQADTGAIAFPNDFKPKDRAAQLHQAQDAIEKKRWTPTSRRAARWPPASPAA